MEFGREFFEQDCDVHTCDFCGNAWSLQEWKGEWREIHYGFKGETLKHETPAKVCESCLLVPRPSLFDRWRGRTTRAKCNVDAIRDALGGDDRVAWLRVFAGYAPYNRQKTTGDLVMSRGVLPSAYRDLR